MKKLTTSVSPFLMLLVPVLAAILLSLSYHSQTDENLDELTTTTRKTTAQKLVKTGEASVIRLLLK